MKLESVNSKVLLMGSHLSKMLSSIYVVLIFGENCTYIGDTSQNSWNALNV